MNKDATFGSKAIIEYFRKQCDNSKIALVCGQIRLSYQEWYNQAKTLSRVLKDTHENGPIGILLENSIEYCVAYFGILLAGRTVLPIYYRSSEEEVGSILKQAGCALVITCKGGCERLKQINAHYIAIEEKGYLKIEARLSRNSLPEITNLDELKNVVVLLRTSGTTNRPKLVMHTNQSLITNALMHGEALQMSQSDVTLVTLPLPFGYANMTQLIVPVVYGQTIVLNNSLFPKGGVQTIISEFKVTDLTAVPTSLAILFNGGSSESLSTLKRITFGGAPPDAEILNRIHRLCPNIKLYQTYGMTEAGPRVTAKLWSNNQNPANVGRPLSGVDIKIQGSNKDGLGLIKIKTPSVMKGYLGNTDDNKNIFDNGWLVTGDIGYLAANGELFLKGRKTSMIITGGLNVFPEEVEEAIRSFSEIKDARVYGVPDKILGERIEAEVEIASSRYNERELKINLKKKLSDYKQPLKIHKVRRIERTYNGKLKRTRERYD